jgi:hypothetical protein
MAGVRCGDCPRRSPHTTWIPSGPVWGARRGPSKALPSGRGIYSASTEAVVVEASRISSQTSCFRIQKRTSNITLAISSSKQLQYHQLPFSTRLFAGFQATIVAFFLRLRGHLNRIILRSGAPSRRKVDGDVDALGLKAALPPHLNRADAFFNVEIVKAVV